MANEKDYLDELIEQSKVNDPGFAKSWLPFEVMGELVGERVRLKLTQADVAKRMGIAQPAVARMENNPASVSFGRIAAYAEVLGAGIAVKTSKGQPSARTTRKPIAGKANALA